MSESKTKTPAPVSGHLRHNRLMTDIRKQIANSARYRERDLRYSQIAERLFIHLASEYDLQSLSDVRAVAEKMVLLCHA